MGKGIREVIFLRLSRFFKGNPFVRVEKVDAVEEHRYFFDS